MDHVLGCGMIDLLWS